MTGADPAQALRRRLAAVAPHLGVDPRDLAPGALLGRLVDAVRTDLADDRVWLLHVALTTVFPDQDAVRRVRRGLALRGPGDAERWLLETTLPDARAAGVGAVDLLVIDRGVVVDVDFSARHTLNTGVQRVVRALLPRWHRDHPEIVPVAWTKPVGALRALGPDEEARTLRWDGDPHGVVDAPAGVPTVVVPWRSVVVLPEVAGEAASARLAAMAATSGNEVVAVGYDCIPVISAQLLPRAEPERFTRYLGVVKHCRRVAAISASAAGEFGGFAAMLAGQGLVGPALLTVELPAELPGAGAAPPDPDPDPLVLAVGTLDTRKNPLAVLQAAEVLWREGRSFRLQFVSGGGPVGAAGRRIEALAAAGRRVGVARGVSDRDLGELYRRARFTVFVSLHEGYGLPLAESFAHGVPAVATAYGSVGELAAGGGALPVDPRDDAAVEAAMRTLLDDDAVLARLRDEIAARPRRTWDDYAAELWSALVEPGLRGRG